MNDALSAYRGLEIGSSSAETLVLRLYEAALRHCRAACDHLREGRPQDRTDAVSKALAIVAELQQVLDFERGGEVARELDRLYRFASDRLVAACLEDERQGIDDALRVLSPLRDGWAEMLTAGREDAA